MCETIEQSLDRHKLEVSDKAKNYIITMLERFADTLKLFPEQRIVPITFQYRRLVEENSKLWQRELGQELGDHCLFLMGYFYDFVRRGGEGQVEYHSLIGSTAYQQTGQHPFVEIARNFNDLYLVIADLHLPELDDPKKLIQVYQKWMETKDRYYESLLRGKGIVPQPIKKESN